MPFQYILANLLAKNDDAIAVLFLDEMGETVDLACADYTHYDMKILGAYAGIFIRQIDDILRNNEFGNFEMMHVERDGFHLYAGSLPDDYYLVLVQHRPALVARARATLQSAREELAREIFDA